MTGTPCPTCRRTYGAPVDDPRRCGCCLTGLSLDGQPVFPRQAPDGTWRDTVLGDEVLQLGDGTWTFYLGDELGSREQQIEWAETARAAGEW